MTRKQKKMVARIAASAVLLVAAVLIPYEGPWRFVLFLPAYFVIGWDVLWKAARNIAHGQVFDENFLMALATVGAFCTGFFGEGEYPEAVFVMLFYQVGEPVSYTHLPHRGVFYALKREKVYVSGDIGCYTLGASAPLSAMDACVCMGASVSRCV